MPRDSMHRKQTPNVSGQPARQVALTRLLVVMVGPSPKERRERIPRYLVDHGARKCRHLTNQGFTRQQTAFVEIVSGREAQPL
jgi:hypothetical protein